MRNETTVDFTRGGFAALFLEVAMNSFVKVVNPGKIEINGRFREMFVRIEFRSDGGLSLSGVVGPWHSGNCAGSCGQCDEELEEIGAFHTGWSKETVKKLRQVWNDWHLNHMRPGCVHQAEWDTSKMLETPDGEVKEAGWVTTSGHPEGLLNKPCPVCGYKYGSAWNKEAVPDGVSDWLRGLPDTRISPAWA
jgi:hypothetical protein